MLVVLAFEDDRAAPPNVHARAVAELHGPDDACVQLGEDLAIPGHVVAGAGV